MFNILICDDDKDIVDAIEIYLASEGYNILKAYDGIQAIDIIKHSHWYFHKYVEGVFNYC